MNTSFDIFGLYKKIGVSAVYHRVPIVYLERFRKVMADEGKYFKLRYRGPRFNVPSARFRGYISKASTCLKQDATHFSAYYY
jgi:hypothetical protein